MGSIYDRFWEEKVEYDKSHPVEMVKVRVDENPNFNLAILRQNIDHIDMMSDSDLRKFIRNCFKSILRNLFQGPEAPKYIRCFQTVRFLDAFIDITKQMVINENINLSLDDVVICNTMCYDYITMEENPEKGIKKDSKIVDRMIMLSKIINNRNLPRLQGLRISGSLAAFLLMARYSNINLELCVKRVNCIIITQPSSLMTEAMIEDIYKILFDVMRDMYMIFPYIMTDVVPDYDEYDKNTHWVTDEIQNVSSALNLAILNIVDNLGIEMINNIIYNYSEAMNIVHPSVKKRFSLRCLSEDYSRINIVVRGLIDNGINVP